MEQYSTEWCLTLLYKVEIQLEQGQVENPSTVDHSRSERFFTSLFFVYFSFLFNLL